MDYARLLREVWNWLPAFRTVAETGHLSNAARTLHISPSAVSRTIRLIEQTAGVSLFVRRARKLVLTVDGQRLLEATRRGMDVLGSGLARLGSEPAGDFRISSLGPITNDYLVPCLLKLRPEFPAVTPVLTSAYVGRANALLLGGDLELALYYHPVHQRELVIDRLGQVRSSVYCGQGHSLWHRRSVTLRDTLEHAYSVPQLDETGASLDEWPPELSRRVGFRLLALATQVEVVRSGQFISVMPDATAAQYVKAGELRRLCAAPVSSSTIYAAYPMSGTGNPYLERLVAALRKQFLVRKSKKRRTSETSRSRAE